MIKVAHRLTPLAAAALAALSLAGCSSATIPEPAISDVSSFQSPAPARVLAAGDRIHVIAFGSERISGDYKLNDAGLLALPGYGSIHAAGLTTPRLEERIAALMAEKGVADPRVSVLAEDD